MLELSITDGSVFNPLAPCGARLNVKATGNTGTFFSIHSPLAGRDMFPVIASTMLCNFQSTRPLRGETISLADCTMTEAIFNPLAPCGARPMRNCGRFAGSTGFQSTRPLRGETFTASVRSYFNIDFSIHSPLAGRDLEKREKARKWLDFSIHSPLAGRDSQGSRQCATRRCFQSTRPLRGETGGARGHDHRAERFQSTRPLRGET